MYEILPNLYLSGYNAVTPTSTTFLVNCTKDLPMKHEHNVRIAVNDDMSYESLHGMFLALPEIVERIDTELHGGKQVIVHCLAGQQRSPAVIAGYLLGKRGYTLDEAITYIRSKKIDAFFWTVNFKDSLEQYQMSLTLPKL